MAFYKKLEKGFTLVEMLVVAPIVIITIGAFLTVIISMTGEVLSSRGSNSLSYNVQDALNRIEQDVKMSNSYLATNNVPLAADSTYTTTGINTNEKQGYKDDTTSFTNAVGPSGTSLILSMVATSTNPVSTSSSYIYLKNKPNACASAPGYNVPLVYNVVYFTKTVSSVTTLYRRTIMPNSYNDTANTVCNTPWQQPSCSPTYLDAQSSSVFCKTKDVVLVSGTSIGFSLQYFNGESSNSANTIASTATLAADRNAALQASTTVSVSIDAQQTAAGRPIRRTAVLRASRLDSNASAIATITSDSVPSAPTVSSSTSEPTNAVFSWPKVTAATGYTFEYQINSGAWNTAFSNQATQQSFTVVTATHKDVVNARVTAINSAGNSGYGTSSVTIPLWTPFSLQNSWVDFSPPYASAAYTKTAAGVILLKGMISSGSGNVATLPAGYRPAMQTMFTTSSSQAASRIDIRSDGTIFVSVGTNAWVSLDGIEFMPASTSFVTPTFAYGWGNYSPASGDPSWQGAGYALDGAGRVQLTGLIRNGTTASGTPMALLPAGYQPDAYMHILNDVGNSATHFSIDSSGNILAKGYGNNYLSLQEMFYPAGRSTGSTCTTQWCALSLQNGWAPYGGIYSTPQYTKGSDGIVMLKGLINSGSSATAQITTLPAGYCPAERSLQAPASNGVWSRLDISRNGDGSCAVLPSYGSTVWLSLDEIRFIAEP